MRPKSDSKTLSWTRKPPQLRNISGEKLYKVDEHIAVAAAGITSDANILVDFARVRAQQHLYTYGQPMPAEDLCQLLCDVKQGYTQYGGVRPFGVSFLLAAWDRNFGYQLYHTDPSGNYNAYRAYAIGQGDGGAQSSLKQEWKEGMTLKEGLLLGIKTLAKTMDTTTINLNKLEIGTLSRHPDGRTSFQILSLEVLKPLVAEVERIRAQEEQEKEAREKGQ